MASTYQERLTLPRGGESAVPRPRTAKRYSRLALWVAFTDAVCIDAAIALTKWIDQGFGSVGVRFVLVLLLAPVLWVGIFAALQLYSLSRLSPAVEFRRVMEGSALTVAIAAALFGRPGHGILASLSRGWLAVIWAFALTFTLATRLRWHRYMGRLRERGDLAYRTLIVGTNDEAVRLAEKFGPRPFLGFLPVGFLRTGREWGAADGLPVLGDIDDLARVVDEAEIECVFIASSAVDPEDMKRVTRRIRQRHVELRISANLADILATRLMVQPIGDLLALSLRPATLTGRQAATKRTFDLIIGGLAILVSAPVWLAAAGLVKLSSRGPVLYRQQRVGRGSRPFTIYKFRTMVRGADALKSMLEFRNEATGPLFKVRDDPRITRVGKWLRRFSIDELPQLINVMKGDMSLVGPRPPLPNEVALYEDWHRDRLEVRPGITGLWQVGGRSELSFDDYVRLDLFYIENWSISYDLFIMGKTIPAVLSRKGAF
jgi:exopolysaccharide biosynthesis polyprenyl glycosylphosphotransferase